MTPADPGFDPALAESYRILRSRLDLSGLPPLSRAVTEHVIHATADFDYVTDLVCDELALAAGIGALRRGAAVVADVPTVASGVTGYPVICKAGDSLAARLARTANITVSAAAVRLAFSAAGPGAVWLVGSTPAALFEIMARQVEPALVIGVPVGFVGAAEAKDALRRSGLASLSNRTEKGRSDGRRRRLRGPAPPGQGPRGGTSCLTPATTQASTATRTSSGRPCTG